jgi:hypothetical protein
MKSHPIFRLMLDGEGTTINRLSMQSGIDARAIRIALLTAADNGTVELDRDFMTWRLSAQAREQLSRRPGSPPAAL